MVTAQKRPPINAVGALIERPFTFRFASVQFRMGKQKRPRANAAVKLPRNAPFPRINSSCQDTSILYTNLQKSQWELLIVNCQLSILTKSLTTAEAMMSPAAGGTKGELPGTERRLLP